MSDLTQGKGRKLANSKTESKAKSETAVMAALRAGVPGVEAWAQAHPTAVKQEDGGTKYVARKSVPIGTNVAPELFVATVEYCATGGENHVRKFIADDGDLMYNAFSIGVSSAIAASVRDYWPSGYVFVPGSVGERGGEGVRDKLDKVTAQLSELDATLIPLIRAGQLDIESLPPASRERISALLAA